MAAEGKPQEVPNPTKMTNLPGVYDELGEVGERAHNKQNRLNQPTNQPTNLPPPFYTIPL